MRPTSLDPAFVALGRGSLAYIRSMPSERVAFLCAEAPLLPPGHVVFVLHAADGQPILVTGTRESALASAVSSHLEAVYVN